MGNGSSQQTELRDIKGFAARGFSQHKQIAQDRADCNCAVWSDLRCPVKELTVMEHIEHIKKSLSDRFSLLVWILTVLITPKLPFSWHSSHRIECINVGVGLSILCSHRWRNNSISVNTLSGEATIKIGPTPSEKEPTLKGKNLLSLGANDFLLTNPLFKKDLVHRKANRSLEGCLPCQKFRKIIYRVEFEWNVRRIYQWKKKKTYSLELCLSVDLAFEIVKFNSIK